jgi:YTH domain-containing family protein
MQPKAEKSPEIKSQTQLISGPEVGRAKSDEGQGNNVGMVLDTTKKNEEQSSNVPEILDAACSNKEQPNKIAIEG